MPAPRLRYAATAVSQCAATPSPTLVSAAVTQRAESLAAAYQRQLQVDRAIYRSIFQPTTPPSLSTTSPSLTAVPAVRSSLPSPPASGPCKPQPVSGLWWTAALFIFLSHLIVLYMLVTRRTTTVPIVAFTVFQAWLQLLGITAGYHRLWSHRSYGATVPLRLFLAIIGLQAFQGSGYWWAMRHRLHHRFTDTVNDPHSIEHGFVWAHMGWLFRAPPRFSKLVLVGAKDLTDDWILMWQKRWLLPLYVLCGLLYPAAVGWLLAGGGSGGAMDGVLYVGVVARVCSWHCIWSINSVSHVYGTKHFSLRSTAVCTPSLVQLLQNGEGHHNLHHEFPKDYAHGRGKWEWDPTKWCILLWCWLRLASDCHVTDEAHVRAARADVLLEKARQLQTGEGHSGLQTALPPPPASLPRMSLATFHRLTSPPSSLPFILFRSLLLDVSSFDSHPGGQSLLRAYYGRDATAAMTGEVNVHTEAAERLARGMAVARLVVDGEEEDWVAAGDGNALLENDDATTVGGVEDKGEVWTEETKDTACE